MSVHSVCTRPGWRCRWYPSWLIESSHCSPALGSEAVCSRMGWSGRPWGGLEKKVRHSFQPEGDRGHCEVMRNEILIIRVCLTPTSASLNVWPLRNWLNLHTVCAHTEAQQNIKNRVNPNTLHGLGKWIIIVCQNEIYSPDRVYSLPCLMACGGLQQGSAASTEQTSDASEHSVKKINRSAQSVRNLFNINTELPK